MGLDVTHDAWHGAYSAFNRFRAAVCAAAGGSWPPHPHGAELEGEPLTDQNRWYVPDSVTREAWPGLYAFLCSGDCEGSFPPEVCLQMAADLERLLPALDAMGADWGHLGRAGGPGGAARTYIEGCRLAASLGEELGYH